MKLVLRLTEGQASHSCCPRIRSDTHSCFVQIALTVYVWVCIIHRESLQIEMDIAKAKLHDKCVSEGEVMSAREKVGCVCTYVCVASAACGSF